MIFDYSMIQLFVPFRDKGTLVNEDETMEEAFNQLLSNNSRCTSYHDKPHNLTSTAKKINEARKEENKEPVDDV